MQKQESGLDQIYDLFAARIIVKTVADCYAVLGLVHELYKPMPGRFKDYIAMPKPNMYQSLHSTVIGPRGIPFEVQIRTLAMHRTAEYGIAAHWRYKDGELAASRNENIDNKLTWLRQLLEWQKDMRDADEYLESLKTVWLLMRFCIHPKGDVHHRRQVGAGLISLTISTAAGNRMYGAKVIKHRLFDSA